MKKNTFRTILLLLCTAFVLGVPAFAASSENMTDVNDNNTGIETQSVDRTFTLDFEESQAWYTVGFSNWALLNHNNVSLKYKSYTSDGAVNGNVYVSVDLYIDEDGDGDFERYKSDGSYVQELPYGGTLQYRLPNGMQECNYKLKITNGNNDVLSGTFTLKTFYNSDS